MSLLQIHNLHLAYGDNSVVRDFSFQLKKGEIVVVLGASGDGKTSLLKAIAGLLPYKSGEIIYKGERVKDATQKLVPGHSDIKLINQDFGLDPFHTVEENLRLKLMPYDEAYKQKRITTLLRLTKLTKFRHYKATAISGGQQQRLAIARALADEPELLLMDEPFNQLDFQNKVLIERHIRNYVRKKKISVLLVTHNGIEAMEWADRIIFVKNGRIKRIDKPQDFFDKPRNKYEAGFFGELNKLKLKDRDIYFRPGVFSPKKTDKCTLKLKISYKDKLTLGWYSEYTFLFEDQSFKIFSQQNISNLKELFVHPIL
jgi:ABC-type Fe3+/spermidine/putrescine transport system ATPase subunit